MKVSYICHESKLCVPHWIYQTEKNLVIMSVAHKCKPTFPFSFTLFSPGFSGHCAITRVNVTLVVYITTIKVRHCVAMFATEYVHLVSIFTFCF